MKMYRKESIPADEYNKSICLMGDSQGKITHFKYENNERKISKFMDIHCRLYAYINC